jgi:hypothetical protein
MTRRHRGLPLGLAALIATVGSLFGVCWFARSAQAIIGRPLTPMSYAGVARRTTRRAVAVGAVYPVAPVVVAPPAVVVAPRPVVVAPAPAYW